MTPAQIALLKTAPVEWGPLPTDAHRGVIRALRKHGLIQLAAMPLRWRKNPNRGVPPKRALVTEAFTEAIRNARRRAAKRGLECDLSAEVAQSLWERCKGRCELTMIRFHTKKEDRHQYRAFAPSIDRLDSRYGYTMNNVRVVCTAVNVAMNQWGEAVLRRIAAGLLKGTISQGVPWECEEENGGVVMI